MHWVAHSTFDGTSVLTSRFPACDFYDLQSDNGEVVHIMDSEQRMLAYVFITPPHKINVETLRVSIPMKRLAVFTINNECLVYELNI